MTPWRVYRASNKNYVSLVYSPRLLLVSMVGLLSISTTTTSTVSCEETQDSSLSEIQVTLLGFTFKTTPFMEGGSDKLRLKLYLAEAGHHYAHSEDHQISCALGCGRRRFKFPRCCAFRPNPVLKSCEFYTRTTSNGGKGIMGSSNLQVMEYQLTKTFHRVAVNGRVFSIMLWDVRKSYTDASLHCRRFGGYLLQMDHLDKYTILRKLFGGQDGYGFVGASDAAQEDRWISDKDQSEIQQVTWLWKPEEPNNWHDAEDCAVLVFQIVLLNDAPCDDPLWFLCEKDSPLD